MKSKSATADEIRTALKRFETGGTTDEIAGAIGCEARDVYDPLIRMMKCGDVSRQCAKAKGRKRWVYSLVVHDASMVTPKPYPTVLLTGEWVPDYATARNLAMLTRR